MTDNLGFGLVGGGDFNKDVARVESDLGEFAVDDGWQGADIPVCIQDDRIYRRVSDDM